MTDEQILSLAKNNLCPHYILTNPISKEESIWFSQQELNKWFDENLVMQREGLFTSTYEFFYFERQSPNICEVPEELSSVQNLYQLPLDHIKSPPGIYFLCKSKKIQYIGQSTNVASRVSDHVGLGLKEFDSVFYITCPTSQLDELETAAIRYFHPPLNISKKAIKPTNDDLRLIKSVSVV